VRISEKQYKAMPAELQALFCKCPNPGSDEVVRLFPQTTSGSVVPYARSTRHKNTYAGPQPPMSTFDREGDSGSAARFFYCAKTSKRERGEGNNHPTVKPIALMRYLCRLVTPSGGIVLDPFSGSGTTCVAAKLEFVKFIGIEREAQYVAISNKRLAQGVLF